jgi:hypothetical protein
VSEALSRGGFGLTWVTRSDEIHASNPGSAVEGADVIPDGCVVEISGDNPLAQDSHGVGVVLDVADGPRVRQCDAHAEFEAADSGT